jgi:hypothetical protein
VSPGGPRQRGWRHRTHRQPPVCSPRPQEVMPLTTISAAASRSPRGSSSSPTAPGSTGSAWSSSRQMKMDLKKSDLLAGAGTLRYLPLLGVNTIIDSKQGWLRGRNLGSSSRSSSPRSSRNQACSARSTRSSAVTSRRRAWTSLSPEGSVTYASLPLQDVRRGRPVSPIRLPGLRLEDPQEPNARSRPVSRGLR